MLNYGIQYDIANGVFLTFRNNLAKRTLKVSHGNIKRDKLKDLFPYSKYETFTRENFIGTCLYIMYKHYPSSIYKMLEYLVEVKQEDVIIFKNQIMQYKSYVNQDVIYLREKYGDPTLNSVVKELKKGNIKFYTAWFFLKRTNTNIEEYINQNRINGAIVQKIKQLMLFITFSEKALEIIDLLFDESTLLQNI